MERLSTLGMRKHKAGSWQLKGCGLGHYTGCSISFPFKVDRLYAGERYLHYSLWPAFLVGELSAQKVKETVCGCTLQGLLRI